MKPTKVAYVRYIGPYQGDEKLFENLFNKVVTFAKTREIVDSKTKLFAIYHDDPEITENDKLRTSVCISVQDDIEGSGEISTMVLEGGKYAVARFELDTSEYGEAWKWVYSSWLPGSGYQPDDKACFERYSFDCGETGGKQKVDICVPIRPL